MTDNLDAVRTHYGATGLVERLRAALPAAGPEGKPLTPADLAFDHFHTRGLAATAELATLAGVTAQSAVLDVGSGIGGPARFLAANFGCRVTGVDLSEPFVDAARYLTTRTGQADRVNFEVGSALDLPFGDSTFDAVFLQHVAMNIADRAALYREIRRVLRVGGKLATYDIVTTGGDPLYPVPWARTSATSFVLSAAATQEAIEHAGFRAVDVRDDTEKAKQWAAASLRPDGPRQPLNLGLVMGEGFGELAANLGRSLLQDKVGVLAAVFEAESRRSLA